MSTPERRRRPRQGPAWPNPPAQAQVVLHTRVVTETGGGPDKTIFASALALKDTPYWVAAAYMHPPRDPGFATLRQRAQEAGCPLISVPDRGPLDRNVIRPLHNLCRRYKVKIWHGHDYKSNMLGLMLRPFWDMKLVTTLHGWVKQTMRTPLYYAVDRLSLPFYHHVICVSDDLLESARRTGVPAERCTLLLNAIDQERFARKFPPEQSPLRRKFGVPPGRLVVGAMGRLSPEKAFNFLIRAADQLLRQGVDLELWIAGQGQQEQELQEMVRKLGLTDRVRLLGFCEDTIGFYHALDAFALSSLREGLPNVVLEAMSMSVPVAATDVAGIPKLIENGRNGLLCRSGDVAALAEILHRLLTQPLLRQHLASEGRRTIEERFSFSQRMAREREIYDRVLAQDSPAPAATPAIDGAADAKSA